MYLRHLSGSKFLFFSSVYFTVVILTFDLHGVREVSVWLTSLFFLIVTVGYVFARQRVNREAVYIVLLASLWVFYALIPPAGLVSLEHHLKAIFEYMLYVLAITAVLVGLYGLDNIFKCIQFSFLVFFLLACFVLILLVCGIDVNGSKAFSSFYGNRNTFATLSIIYLAFLLFVPRGYVIRIIHLHKFKYIFILVIMILLTASTKAVLGLLIVFFAYCSHRYGVGRILLFTSALLAFLSLVPSVADLEIIVRLEQKVNVLFDLREIDSRPFDSGKVRALLFLQSLEIISENPLKGIGVNNAQFYMTLPILHHDDTIDSQNNITEMALNAGIVGFALYYVPLFYIMFKLIRYKTADPKLKDLRRLVLTLLSLKISWDIGMKSYNEVHHVFVVVFCFHVYFTVFMLGKSSLKITRNRRLRNAMV